MRIKVRGRFIYFLHNLWGVMSVSFSHFIIIFLNSEEVTKQIADLVEVRVNDLSQLWRQTFDEQIYEQHVRALVGHVTQFFDEVFEESSMRQAGILDKIQCECFFFVFLLLNIKELLCDRPS